MNENVQKHQFFGAQLDSELIGQSLSKLQEVVKGREAWHAVVHGVTKSRTQPSNWTTDKLNFQD